MAIPRNLSILAQGANTTGVLGVAKGGTNAATLTANNVIIGNGTGSVQFVAPGTSGNILTSNGTNWLSSPAPATGVTTLSFGTTGLTPNSATNGAITVAGTLGIANGGTGLTALGTGVQTALGVNVTGTGAIVLATNATITTPSLAGETFSTTATVTAGTNAQGQGALTTDYNVITSTPNNPSGVTLPTATTGRRVVVVNRGANSVSIFPATGASIDAGAANASVSLQANGVVIFNASSATAWYSTLNLVTSATSGTINPTGGGTDKAFNVNSLTVTTNYTIPSGYSAQSTGPITVNSGVTVTIPSGSKWVVL